eukprot:gene3417-4039_t
MSPFGPPEKQALLEAPDLKTRAETLIAITEIVLARTDRMADNPTSLIDPKMLELLVCPLTQGTLKWDREKSELVSEKARLAYPIRDGIPIMLVSEARKLEMPV